MHDVVCREAKGVVVTKQSKWKQQWQGWRENNPISNSKSGIPVERNVAQTIVQPCMFC